MSAGGLLTNDGRKHIGELINRGILLAGAVTASLTHFEIGKGVADIALAGVTFSVSATDRSFNDSGAGFIAAGIVVGTVLTVAGFANGANNGNFEVLSVTTTKILVKNNTTLVTESAGPAVTIGGWVITATDASVKTPLAVGGRRALDAGYPQVVQDGTNPTLVVQATYPAGSFSTGTPLTEAIWTNSGGTVCGGRTILATAKNPTASEPITVTASIPLYATKVT